jgi:hypothetical protein
MICSGGVCSIAGIMNGSRIGYLLFCPRVKRAQSDWQATVTLGCPRCMKHAPVSQITDKNSLAALFKKK